MKSTAQESAVSVQSFAARFKKELQVAFNFNLSSVIMQFYNMPGFNWPGCLELTCHVDPILRLV